MQRLQSFVLVSLLVVLATLLQDSKEPDQYGASCRHTDFP